MPTLPNDDASAIAALIPATTVVSPEAFDRLTAILDAPPAPTPRLAALLASPTPWDNP